MKVQALLGAAAATALTAGLALPGAASAQTAADVLGCAGVNNSACVTQIGDLNRTVVNQRGATASTAFVHIDGDRNGRGSIESITRQVWTRPGAAHAGVSNEDGDKHTAENNSGGDMHDEGGPHFLTSREVESGLVRQRGASNAAAVLVDGDRNDFHVTQDGSNNAALQVIDGNRNTAVALQNAAAPVSDNVALQVQRGNRNFAYVGQHGSNNLAAVLQGGEFHGSWQPRDYRSVELSDAQELVSGRGFDNEILLVQNGDDNRALLIQTGDGNKIALEQPGEARARIFQNGGRTVALKQVAGVNGVVTPVTIRQN